MKDKVNEYVERNKTIFRCNHISRLSGEIKAGKEAGGDAL